MKNLHPMPPLPASDACLFLDVDGTLLEFSPTPASVRADRALQELLSAIAADLDGALALVSGRSIAMLDVIFAPWRPAAAGLHGIERRSATGELHGERGPDRRLDAPREALHAFTAGRPRTFLEDKGRALALHFNGAPQFEREARAAMRLIAAPLGAHYHVLDGHMVVELKPSLQTKGTAIREFLREAPFANRRPVYVGDDLTDRDGFVAVEAYEGMSVAVGNRVRAQYHCENPQVVRAWLERFAATLNSRAAASPARCPESK